MHSQFIKPWLEALGYTGNINVALKNYLVDQGYLGQLNGALYRFLGDEGYTGQFSERYQAWLDVIKGGVSIPSYSLVNRDGSYILNRDGSYIVADPTPRTS